MSLKPKPLIVEIAESSTEIAEKVQFHKCLKLLYLIFSLRSRAFLSALCGQKLLSRVRHTTKGVFLNVRYG